MSPKPVVLAIAGDPGGAAAVAPVIEMLQKEHQVIVQPVSYGNATAMWIERGIQTSCHKNDCSMHPETIIKGIQPSLLLTGTSCNHYNYEQRFIAAAREYCLSISLLDFWSTYRRRFSDTDDNLVYLPTFIAVMDDYAKADMVKCGFNSSMLVVTGQPALDDLADWEMSYIDKARIRHDLGIGEPRKLLVFVSQPLSVLHGDALGYTEQSVLTLLIETLKQINQPVLLAIRSHPRENPKSFPTLDLPKVKVIVFGKGHSRDLVLAADVVIGMNSILLLESCLMGCATISIQPDLKGEDPLPSNRMGLSLPVYNKNNLKSVLEAVLANPSRYRPKPSMQIGTATRAVTDLIYRTMGIANA